MRCDLCVIAKYCLNEPKTWQFKSNKEALKVLDIMNNCLEVNVLPVIQLQNSQPSTSTINTSTEMSE